MLTPERAAAQETTFISAFFFYPFLLLADNHISFLSTGGFFALLLALASRLLHELKPKEVA